MSTLATYDFGLSADEEARARRLHDDSIVIDLLFQGPCGYACFAPATVEQLRERFARTGDASATMRAGILAPIREAVTGASTTFEDCWRASGVTAGNRQIEPGDPRFLELTAGMAQVQFDRLGWLDKALTAADIRGAKAAGRHAGYVSTQLTYGPFRELASLDALHDLGLRMCGLAYNRTNALAVGCTEGPGGLSRLGVAAVERMNELGILVDVSHAGAGTVRDVCAVSQAPAVASHGGAAALHPHDRNLDDALLEAVAATGGVIGVAAVPFFLGAGAGLTIEAMLDHVDHVVAVVGWEHAAIGTDWPMQLPKWALTTLLTEEAAATGFRPEHGLDLDTNLVGFDDYRDWPNITRGLVARGYDDDAVRAIVGGNALRVFEQVWG
ncbi:MAG TPA: membrane dipeptidase [Nitriliruptorales bacterium]